MKTLNCFEFLLLNILSLAASNTNSLLPSISLCNQNDPKFSECFCKNVNDLIPIIKDGVPEMNLKQSDPFFMGKNVMDMRESQTINLFTTFTNISGYGLSTSKIANCNFQLDANGLKGQLDVYIPVGTIIARFNAVGSLMLLKLNSTGQCKATIREVFVRANWTSTKYVKAGKDHLKIDADEDIEFNHLQVHFNNLIGSNTELNDRINTIFSENIDELFKEFKPFLLHALKIESLNYVNDLFGTFPLDTLFPL